MFYYIRNIFDKDMSAFDSSAIDIPPITNDIEVDNEIQQIFMLPDFLDVGFCFLNSGKTIIFFNYVIVTMYYYIFLLLIIFVGCVIRKQRIIEMRNSLMSKYKVSYEELINLYISHLRNWLRESLMESRGFAPTLVMSLVNEHVLINSGDLNNRKKWSKQYKEYQANLVQARRAVVEFEKVAFPNVKCYSQGGRRFSTKVKSSLHYGICRKPSYKRGYEFATYPLEVVFDNVEGPKLSFEEKNLTDSIFNAVIKYYKMTYDEYIDILSKVKLNRPEMLFQSEDSKGIEYHSNNCEIDVDVDDDDEVLHGEIEDKAENYDKQEVEHVTRDLLYNMEDLFNENFVSLSYDCNMNDVSLCRRTKRVNSVCQTDRRITRQRKSISS